MNLGETVDSQGVGSTVPDGSLNDRAARIFEFLVQLQRLRTRVVRSVDAYRSVMWFGQLPFVEGLQFGQETDPGVWLTIDRIERVPPPSPPDLLRPWITERSLRDSAQTLPSLSGVAARAVQVVTPEGDLETVTEELLLEDHPEVADALREWAPVWQAWATDDQPRAAIGEAYHHLYAMYQDSRALAETYEIVLGFGCLVTTSGGQDVRRHLVTTAATIELDLDSGRLTVVPSPDARPPALEEDMLDPQDTASDELRQAIRAGLQSLDDPWASEPDGVSSLLRSWVNGSGPDAAFVPDIAPPGGHAGPDGPSVTFAPALILRERTKRSFVAACEQIIAMLRAGVDVPSGVRQFAEITDGRVFDADQHSWEQAYADEEVYFPKAANDEQRQIRDRLADHQTVVVQGPPGTGKTHTIANLISDLLAHGQRVLVTSTTTRALTVLKEKLPSDISDLCVSVTDDAVKGQADLEQSVTTILDQADRWNSTGAEREAADLRRRLADARDREQTALTELRTIRELETYVYAPDVGDYSGTLQEIAERLAEEESTSEWLGRVTSDQPTLSMADVSRFLDLLRRATRELRALTGTVPQLGELVPPAEFEQLAERRSELNAREADLTEARGTDEFLALANTQASEREQIRRGLGDLSHRRRELERRNEPWIAEALRDITGGRDRMWRHRQEMTAVGIDSGQSWLTGVDGRIVAGLDALDFGEAVGHASALFDHLSQGGKLKGLLGRSKIAKAASPFLDQVRVDGREIEDLDHLRPAHSQAMVEKLLAPLEEMWGYRQPHTLPQAQRIAVLADENKLLADVLSFADAVVALGRRLQAVPAMPAVDLNSTDELTRLLWALDALDLMSLQVDVRASVDRTRRILVDLASAPGSVAAVRRAADALGGWDPAEYRAAFHALEAAHEANSILVQLGHLQHKVAAAAPDLAVRIEETRSDLSWDERLPRLSEAWAWSVWDERLRAKTDPLAEQRWRASLDAAEVDARAALERLATNRGWAHALRRLTPRESTHLKMYAQAVRKAGKGTGKYVNRYREDARKSLQECQGAVPAWIMPMHQVFDTVPVDRPNLFDVVIVDEASQSGLEGLLLSWLAPRMVVVGDDKQVSPSNVGLDHEAVFTLQDRYLAPLEHKALFGPLNSFFDQAVGMASRIMLREHFRCMPEIIGFSNELCYHGALVPLRQYGADRLPPLRTTYVKGAVVSGRRDVVNEPEAEEIVAQIEKCCADPAYDGKSMGVISLLGHAQDKLIMQRLVDALGVRVVEQRKLRAGNAEAFQGDERDVIFISMVSSLQSTSGPARIGTLSKESDQQRLNVAASRARDQVWLFHSVQPGDLSGKDLRQRYLRYLLKPLAEQDALDIGDVLPDRRHSAFDSLFEQRVFLAARERGFRVRPQVKVGGYRIDLVIEGGTQRLAVECDGDAFHDGEAAWDDAARQRDLERVGWTFWRIRGSVFFRDPEQALEPLWELLEKLEIQPTWGQPTTEDTTATHVAVEAPAVPVSRAADDLLDEYSPGGDSSEATTTVSPAASVQTVFQQPSMADRRAQRFSNGKMLLSSAARRRVRDEAAAIEEWLADPPPVRAVDGRSHDVEVANREQHRDDLDARLHYLERVLSQSIVDPSKNGGSWVTPGCITWLQYPGEDDVDRLFVTIMPHADGVPADTSPVSPLTDLAQAIEGAQPGDTVHFNTPRGIQQAVVVEVQD
ncbi:AAA domain-containing protein [Kribbella sp. NBC_01484]|uniref:AAA domain-containing protein n=1 Tax=Kribbella sp. NBC_01484 TaxID=2903579 RepID=UPI002E32AC49|nr:AAA domain-containing protein [Kribbella sp. NBC_01484]